MHFPSFEHGTNLGVFWVGENKAELSPCDNKQEA